jgi:hypothetical protein
MDAPPTTPVYPDDQPPEPLKGTTITDRNVREVGGVVYKFKRQPLYTAHGKWSWVNDHHFISRDPGTPLGCM